MIHSFDVVFENKDAILFADEKAFYIAELHKKLTTEQLSLLRLGGCTVEQMQQMGISGTTIARADIRGIAVQGYDRADELTFHLSSKKKLSLLFSRHYDTEEADAFFRGLPRFQKAKGRHARRGRRHRDWHVREQDPALRKGLDRVGLALKWAAALTLAAMLLWPAWMPLWLALGIFYALTSVGLLIFFEPYFTLMDDDDYRKAGYSAKIISLNLLPFLPLAVMLFWADRYTVLSTGKNWAYGFAIGAVIALTMWVLLRELHDNMMHAVTVFAVAVTLSIVAVTHANHYYAPEEMVSHPAQVVDKDMTSSRRSRDYDLTVVLEDGRKLILDVGSETYEQTEIGDTISVDIRTGVLGIEYAMYGQRN